MDGKRSFALMKVKIPLRPFLLVLGVLFVYWIVSPIGYWLVSTRKIAHPNPTSYTFHLSEDQLIELVRAYSYDDSQQSLRERCPNPEGLSVNRQYAQFFVPPGQHPDNSYTLTVRMEPPNWQKSDLYFLYGKPLNYDADYKVLVTPAGDSMTDVRVETTNYELDIGPVFSFHGGELAKPVKPTTIEEYRFLLTLGCVVGETGMPALELPH